MPCYARHFLFCSVMSFICLDGLFLPAEVPHVSISSPAFKWGEGVFETMKVWNGKILLATYHFERLFSSLRLLEMKIFVNTDQLARSILDLCNKNNCLEGARVRLSVFRKTEGDTGWSIEAIPWPYYEAWDEKGWQIGIYPDACKVQDAFSNLKTANYLSYAMASRYAKAKGWEEAILLNQNGYVCDGSKTNIFVIHENQVITPSLDQGCISGVMRRYILENKSRFTQTLVEAPVNSDLLNAAEEIFLTNAIIGIRSVRNFKEKQYGQTATREIFDTVFSTNDR